MFNKFKFKFNFFFSRSFCTPSNDLVINPDSKRLNFIKYEGFRIPISFRLSQALIESKPQGIPFIKFQGSFIISDENTRWKRHVVDFEFESRDFKRFELVAGRYKKGIRKPYIVSIIRFDGKRYYENTNLGAFLHVYLSKDRKN